MKLSTALAEPGNAVVVAGAMQQKGAHLAVDASIFNILSRMYSRPEEAVTRELLCNANDAHVMVGRGKTPFDLYLPTNMKPEWTLRDYGTGLSKDDVFRLIGGYGESNKRSSLETIGGFGIGAKSPFAVTSQFTVTSWHGGKQYLFAFYKDDEDKPVLSLMHESDSDEPTGMRFSFPVPPTRISNYITATEVVLARWSGAPPKIHGYDGRVWSKVKYRIERPGFGLRDHQSSGTYRPAGVFATMGGVAYPIDTKQLAAKYHSLSDANLDLFFSIGDLKPAPSRESLEMTPAVVKTIEDRIDEVSRSIREEAEKIIGTPKTMLEAIEAKRKLNEFVATLPAAFRQFIVADMTFKGVKVPDNTYGVRLDIPGVTYFTTGVYSLQEDGAARVSIEMHNRIIGAYSSFGLTCHIGFMFRRDTSEDILKTYNRVLNINTNTIPDDKIRTIMIINADRRQDIIDRLAIFGIETDFGYLEDIQPAVVPKKVREKTKMRFMKPGTYSPSYQGSWEETEVDLEQGGIYQILERGKPILPWIDNFITLMRQTDQIGTMPRIYGIPLSTKSRLTKYKKVWRPFEEWALERIKTLPLADYLRQILDFDEYEGLRWLQKLDGTSWENEIAPTSYAYETLKLLSAYPHKGKTWRQCAQQTITLLSDLKIDTQPAPSKFNFAAREAKLSSDFPLVAAFCTHASLYQVPDETMQVIYKTLS